jgi:hypothetical protein
LEIEGGNPMSKDFLRKTAIFVIFIFCFFLASDSFPEVSAVKKSGKELLNQGVELYKDGEYEKALEAFKKAEPLIEDNNQQVRLYLHMSLTHYALGDTKQTELFLQKVFQLNPKFDIHIGNYPWRFLKIVDKVTAEVKKKLEEEEGKKVIQEPIEKKKKKKFPVFLVVAGIAVVGLLAVLLSKKESKDTTTPQQPTTGSIRVESTPDGASVWLDGSDTGKKTNAILENINPGSHIIKLIKEGYQDYETTVTVEAGKQAAVSASLQKSIEGDNPPSVSIVKPGDNETVSGTITVRAEAADDKGIDKVDFYIDDSLVESDTDAPYRFSWDTTTYSNGPHTIKAVAYDTANQTATHQVTVTVQQAADNPPFVSITQPGNGDTVGGTVTVRAEASDDQGITKVEFYIDNSLIESDTTAPYRFSWDTANVSNGSHTIKAIAYDTANQTAEDQVTVTVQNYDIRGTWKFNVYTQTGTNNYTLTFNGSLTQGNVFVNGKNRGDYKVNGDSLEFTLYDDDFDNVGKDWKYTFTGTFTGENNMSGNYLWENFNNGVLEEQETGNWDASKQ